VYYFFEGCLNGSLKDAEGACLHIRASNVCYHGTALWVSGLRGHVHASSFFFSAIYKHHSLDLLSVVRSPELQYT